jgi:hypothetical protein
MKSVRLLACVLVAGLQGACASSGVSDHGSRPGSPAPPADVLAIQTYWRGEEPPCPVIRVAELSARTENGLRWEAWNARAQAVVSVVVRARTDYSAPDRPAAMSQLYEGVAVRYADGCTPPQPGSAD